jgi:hypothetical protein
VAGAGIRWRDFGAAAPEIARAGQRLLEDRPGVPGAAFLGTVGSAERTDDPSHRTQVAERMPYSDIDEHHTLYEFRIDRALWTTWPTPTAPVHHTWRLTTPPPAER